MSFSRHRPRLKYPAADKPGIVSIIPTPILLTVDSFGDAFDLAATIVTGNKFVSEIESAANLIEPTRVARSADRGLEVFPQISFGVDRTHLGTSDVTDALAVMTTYKPRFINVAVEYTTKGEDWFARNKDNLKRTIMVCKAAMPAVKICLSVLYEDTTFDGLRVAARRMVELGCDAFGVTSYPQTMDPDLGPVGDRYFDKLEVAVDGMLPIMLTEWGWHTRNSTGDQAVFCKLIMDKTMAGEFLISTSFFLHDSNNYPGIFGAFFSDMGLYDTSGALKPAAHIFNAIAAVTS